MRNKSGVSGFEAYLVIAHIAQQLGITPVACFQDIERKFKQITEEMKKAEAKEAEKNA